MVNISGWCFGILLVGGLKMVILYTENGDFIYWLLVWNHGILNDFP